MAVCLLNKRETSSEPEIWFLLLKVTENLTQGSKSKRLISSCFREVEEQGRIPFIGIPLVCVSQGLDSKSFYLTLQGALDHLGTLQSRSLQCCCSSFCQPAPVACVLLSATPEGMDTGQSLPPSLPPQPSPEAPGNDLCHKSLARSRSHGLLALPQSLGSGVFGVGHRAL